VRRVLASCTTRTLDDVDAQNQHVRGRDVAASIALVGVVSLLGIALGACGGGSSRSNEPIQHGTPVSAPEASVVDPSVDGLKAAGIAYTHAVLDGSYADLLAILDPSCPPVPASSPSARLALGNAELEGFQRLVQLHTGIPASKIKIVGLELRNVQAAKGDAEAQYGLPASEVGNDNWNSFAYSDGRWHLSGCAMQAPMGGEGSSSTATTEVGPSVAG